MRAFPYLPHVLQGAVIFLILALSVHLSRSAKRKARRAQWTHAGVFSKINARLMARRGLA